MRRPGIPTTSCSRSTATSPTSPSATRLPPTFTDEGIRAAPEARCIRLPELGVLVLSQYVEPAYTTELLEAGEGGAGYLLKERVGEACTFVEAVERVAAGGTVLDREVVSASSVLGRARGRLH